MVHMQKPQSHVIKDRKVNAAAVSCDSVKKADGMPVFP
jgi:hypothetical protein